MNNNQPLFTVLIPTRERCDTLAATLRTCVSQDDDNFEIVVSDNFSQDATRVVIESFHDSRIRHINTGHRVSMTSNWEFGLSHVQHGYVTIIGDDDGLLPGAIRRMRTLMTTLNWPQAVVWKVSNYGWPNNVDANERNRLNIPLGDSVKRQDAAVVLKDVVEFKTLYFFLPYLYSSFVHTDAIAKAKEISDGKFFHSVTPDVYSGIALACVMDSYYFSSRPYSINAASHHSNGAAQLGDSGHREMNVKYESENDLRFHPRLISAPSVAILTAEAYFQAQQFFERAQLNTLDVQLALQSALKVSAIQSLSRYETMLTVVREIAQINHIEEEVKSMIEQTPHQPKDNRAILGYNIAFNTLRLDTTPFAVRDVYDACALCHHVLTLKDLGIHTPTNIAKSTLRFVRKFVQGGGDHFTRSRKLSSRK